MLCEIPVTVAVADEPVLVTDWPTLTVPELVNEFDPPVWDTPPTEEVIVPLLTTVDGPVEVTATCGPPAMVPLLIREPPEIVCGPTVAPAGIVTVLVGDSAGENLGDDMGDIVGENRGDDMDIAGENPEGDRPAPPRGAA